MPPSAAGKKNRVFVGDAGAGETAAIFHTLIESARRCGLDPLACLHDILQRRPVTRLEDIHTLTQTALTKACQKSAA